LSTFRLGEPATSIEALGFDGWRRKKPNNEKPLQCRIMGNEDIFVSFWFWYFFVFSELMFSPHFNQVSQDSY
jgi:hypothetical protein